MTVSDNSAMIGNAERPVSFHGKEQAYQETDLLVIQALLPYVQSSVLDDSDSIYGFSYLTI